MLDRLRETSITIAILCLSFNITSLIAGESVVGNRTIVFYQDRDKRVAAEILQVAEEFGFPGKDTGTENGRKILIYIASSEKEFSKLTSNLIPDWGVACAFPAEGKIVIRSPRLGKGFGERLNLILKHELCHVYLYQYLKEKQVPHWFDEGFAVYLSGEWRLRSQVTLAMALVTNSVIPLKDIDNSFPAQKSEADLAYLESYTVIEYLVKLGGDDGIYHLLKTWQEKDNFDDALRYSYGMTLFQFEGAWKKWVQSRYGWLLILSQITVFWIFVSFVFIGLYILKKKQWKRKLERLNEIEAMEEDLEEDDEDFQNPFYTKWGGWQ